MTARLRELWQRILGLVHGRRPDEDLDAELAAHIDFAAEDNVRRGMPPEKARRVAMAKLGSRLSAREQVGDQRGLPGLEAFFKDVRYAFGSMRRSPRFTITAVLALALGIGASTAAVSLAYRILLAPLPYADAERLVRIYEKRPKQGRLRNVVSAPDYLDWSRQNRTFEGLAAVSGGAFAFTGPEGPELVLGASVTANAFRVLGIQPVLGRDFLPAEERPGSAPVAILTHAAWQRRFGSDPGVVGKRIQLGERTHEIVGVLPNVPVVVHPVAEVWVPLTIPADASRSGHFLDVYGRLKPGVSIDRARTEMDVIAARLEREYPEVNDGHGVNLFPLRDEVSGILRSPLKVLLGAVGLLLLVSCANVANLTLAHMAKRRRELSIRRALGAATPRLVRQLLAESVALALAGGAAGSMLAMWAIGALKWVMPELPRIAEVQLDWRVAATAFGVSLVTAVFFGLAPTLMAARSNVTDALRSEQRGVSAGFVRNPLKAALVSAEVALALMLCIGSGLLFKSFLRLAAVDPGFRTENVLTATLVLSGPRAEPGTARQFHETLIARLEALPGVASVTAAHSLPLTGMDPGYSFAIEGQPPVARSALPNARYRVVMPNYFQATGIAIREGRAFQPQDRDGATRVVIVNESLARQYWPGGQALGKRIAIDVNEWREIVGLAADVKHNGPGAETRGELYFPFAQRPEPMMTVAIRAHRTPENLIPAVRREVAAIDPRQPIARMRLWNDFLEESFAIRRLYTSLVAAFSFIALAMAALGIYGVISYTVGLRTREIGIRMALGARAANVQWMIVKQALRLTAIGVAGGVAGALALGGALRGLLYGVVPTDFATFAAVAALLAAVAVAASYVPVRKATTADSMRALSIE